jgi:hypothetical protein
VPGKRGRRRRASQSKARSNNAGRCRSKGTSARPQSSDPTPTKLDVRRAMDAGALWEDLRQGARNVAGSRGRSTSASTC